jgi:hypothetical protein
MKKYGLILSIVFLALVLPFGQAVAQEKTKEEKEKELQEAINEQKKAMIERQKAEKDAQAEAWAEMDKARIIQREAVDRAMERVRDNVGEIDDPDFQRVIREYRDQARSWTPGEPFVLTPDMGNFNYHFSNGNAERTTWDFSKSIKESSFNRDYVFDVEPTAKSVVMSVSGDCKDGEIKIRIIMPGGKTFSEVVIDEYGNLNWRKSLTITETENQDKTGAWKFEIKASKATGYFKIFFQAS